MTTRETMLTTIRANQPEVQPLPSTFRFQTTYPDLSKQFADTLAVVGGLAVLVADYAAIEIYIREQYAGVTGVATTLPALAHLADFSLNVSTPHELAHIQLAILASPLGVAENGALWLDEEQLTLAAFGTKVRQTAKWQLKQYQGHKGKTSSLRVLPMIAQHLALVVEAGNLVANLHDAYSRIRINQTGFGTFIAGPSKTADIEQSLVIGAHGARSLTVFVLT